MFWNAQLRISQELYLNSRPVMYICRLLGYFPFSVLKAEANILLKWSPYHALYGFALAAFLIIGAYWQAYRLFVNNPEIPMTHIHVLTIFVGYTGWTSALFCGVFVMPTRFQTFFDYVHCLKEIDAAINTKYTKSERYLTILKFMVALAPGLASLVADYRNGTSASADPSTWNFIKTAGILYVMQVISTMVPYIVSHLVLSLKKRLCRLNQLLELESVHLQKMSGTAFVCLHDVQRQSKHALMSRGEYGGAIDIPQFGQFALYGDSRLSILTNTYLKLCDAADILTKLMRETVTVAVLASAIQLLHPAYFLLVYLDGSGYPLFTQAALMNIVKDLAWEICIIDSCYQCSQQIKTTEKFICRLLSWNTSPKYRLKAKRFALCVGLRNIEFSACDFFKINRLLFTDMLGTYTTVLMMLLQLHQDEGN